MIAAIRQRLAAHMAGIASLSYTQLGDDINALLKASNPWISVDDELPTNPDWETKREHQIVMLWIPDLGARMGYYIPTIQEWRMCGAPGHHEVTHWYPIHGPAYYDVALAPPAGAPCLLAFGEYYIVPDDKVDVFKDRRLAAENDPDPHREAFLAVWEPYKAKLRVPSGPRVHVDTAFVFKHEGKIYWGNHTSWIQITPGNCEIFQAGAHRQWDQERVEAGDPPYTIGNDWLQNLKRELARLMFEHEAEDE